MAASNLLYSCLVFRVNRVFMKILAAKKALFVLKSKEKDASRSGYVVPRRSFYSFYIRAAIDRDTMEWTSQFPRSKPEFFFLTLYNCSRIQVKLHKIKKNRGPQINFCVISVRSSMMAPI